MTKMIKNSVRTRSLRGTDSPAVFFIIVGLTFLIGSALGVFTGTLLGASNTIVDIFLPQILQYS